MKVKIRLVETSQPLEFDDVKTTYTKGLLYCVLMNDNIVKKYPIDHIFDIEETYK